MEALIAVLLLVLIAAVAVVGWVLYKRSEAPDEVRPEQQQLAQEMAVLRAELGQAMSANQQTMLGQVNALDQKVNQRLDAVQTSVGQSLNAVRSDVGQSLTATTETIGKIGEQLGGLSESTQRIMQVGRDVSSLKDVLQPPKLRGGFGELLLEQLVKQVLSDERFSTQYRFDDGTVVDMVIHSPEGMVPIDSKFPVESFRRLLEAQTDEDRARLRKAFVRDVKNRIDEVEKYIRPDNGTLDFALMYVPAENVFYETISGDEEQSPMTYALAKRVHICSPNTFHAFLQVVLRGFRGLKVQEEAKEIMGRLDLFKREFAKFHKEFEVLGTHVGRAKNKYDEIDNLAGRLTDKLEIEVPVQGTLLEEPQPKLLETDADSVVPEPLRLRPRE